MQLKHLRSAFRKLTRRKKRDGYYEGADILREPEKENIIYLATVILTPILIGLVIVLINQVI